MLCLTPDSFRNLLRLIQHHEVFQTTSNHPQAPVETQLAVILYHMGQFGNGASVSDLARMAGISEGSVEKYPERCQKAIPAHHDQYVWMVSDAKKEVVGLRHRSPEHLVQGSHHGCFQMLRQEIAQPRGQNRSLVYVVFS
jgi:hypothetical protein